jgi:hypothetical protein
MGLEELDNDTKKKITGITDKKYHVWPFWDLKNFFCIGWLGLRSSHHPLPIEFRMTLPEFLVSLCIFFRQGLTEKLKLSSNSPSSCFSLLSGGITGMINHTWLSSTC